MNRAILCGNLTKDVELRTTPNGKQVASTSLATNKTYKDSSGNKQQVAVFHNLVIWGKGAEIIAQYTAKGSKVLVEGEINNRSYEDKEGNKKYISEVIVREFEFLDNKKDNQPKQENKYSDNDKEVGNNDSDDNSEISVDSLPF